ncbi:MAG: hypothetical protein CL420_01615 [Acidimicrobiaceae bacterium]|nr:hypothetical protein [Acidimicrobiaceae bacterium]
MRYRTVCIIFLFSFVVSCSSAENVQDGVQNNPSSTTEIVPTSTTKEATSTSSTTQPPVLSITIEPTIYSPIAASLDIQSSKPVAVQVTATSENHQVVTPRTSSFSSAHSLPLVGLRQSHSYNIEVLAIDEAGLSSTYDAGNFVSGEINYPLPEFDIFVDFEHAQPGVTLIEYNAWAVPEEFGQGEPLIGLDHEGQIIFWYQNTGTTGAVQATERGTFISQYFPVGAREFDLLGNVTHNWQVDPEPPEIEMEFRRADALAAFEMLGEATNGNEGDPDPVFVKPDWVNLTSFHHEVFPMPNGNLLGLSTTNHKVSSDLREVLCPGDEAEFEITSDVIVEFTPDGETLRTWDLWDVLDVEELPGNWICNVDGLFESVDFRDWTHANAVIYDEKRDAILVSSRHTDQIIAFNHLEELGPQTSVRWILGRQGTLPLEGESFYHPHAVELQSDGSILLYDNGNFRPNTRPENPEVPNYSRAVLYEINDISDNPAEWSATQLWEHRVDDFNGDPLFASFLGDADRVENGNVLITHGGIWLNRPDGFQRARIIEVVPEGSAGGEIVWDLALGDEEVPITIYRSERLPSLYFGPLWEDFVPNNDDLCESDC